MSDSKSRLYGGHPEISSSDVHAFYRQRLLQHTPLGAVILNHKNNIPEKRDLSERQKLMALLGDIPAETRVLDLGCGTGRLASFFVNRVEKYVGIDFTASFIDYAKSQYAANPEFEFHVASITELNRFAELYTRSFNLIIATGILMYVNDDVVLSTLQQVVNLLLPQAQVYARESVSVIGQRIKVTSELSGCLVVDQCARPF